MTDIELNDDDLLVEVFRNEPTGNLEEDLAQSMRAPIRITHKPTGISTIGGDQGTQAKNREKAIEELKEILTKKRLNQLPKE